MSAKRQTHLARRALVRHREMETRSSTRSETAALPQCQLGSVMWVALDGPEILYATKTAASFIQSPDEVGDGPSPKREVRCLAAVHPGRGLLQTRMYRRTPDVYGDSDWAGKEEGKRTTHWSDRGLRRSPARRCFDDVLAGRAVQRGGEVLGLQPRERR